MRGLAFTLAAVLALSGPTVAQDVPEAACPPPASLEGLAQALEDTGGEAARDGASGLRLLERRLALTCAVLADREAEIAILKAHLDTRRRLLEVRLAQVEDYEAHLADVGRLTPRLTGRSCLWPTVLAGVGGLAVGVAAESD